MDTEDQRNNRHDGEFKHATGSRCIHVLQHEVERDQTQSDVKQVTTRQVQRLAADLTAQFKVGHH